MGSQVAVVAGATGTLGSLLVRSLAERGLDVVAVSRSGAAVGAGESVSVAADLGDDTCVTAVRDALPEGSLAMLVSAVGLPGAPGVMDVEPAMLGAAVDLKCGGLLRLLRAVDDRIVDGSRVVAIGGHLGQEPGEHAPLPGVANAALASLVRQLVRPLGRRGATVHLVAPGPFESDRVDALLERRAAARGTTYDQERAALVEEFPAGRLPTAVDVAWAVILLLDPSASVMTGSMLGLDAGARHGLF
jgi:NAD(P)-dependent dehydrogenase (short-subunit alcohol dehydrogenase family)